MPSWGPFADDAQDTRLCFGAVESTCLGGSYILQTRIVTQSLGANVASRVESSCGEVMATRCIEEATFF